MIHRTELQMRFSDTDALGHVNNVSFAAYAETGRVDFLQRLGKSVTSLILANVTIDYRRQIAFGESLHIESWVATLGRSSITLGQSLWANGERAADIKSVVVHFDYTTGKPIELTAAIRKELEPMLRSDAAP
jgi:YbgC/YbaW family acyl-CoA thioester hydrolase